MPRTDRKDTSCPKIFGLQALDENKQGFKEALEGIDRFPYFVGAKKGNDGDGTWITRRAVARAEGRAKEILRDSRNAIFLRLFEGELKLSSDVCPTKKVREEIFQQKPFALVPLCICKLT